MHANRSFQRAVERALAQGTRANVGANHPARFPFQGPMPRGVTARHNVGAQAPAGLPASMDPETRQLIARLLARCRAGSSISWGVGLGDCDQVPLPDVPTGVDGCPEGWVQCKQELPLTAASVAAGATAAITVTPRRVATPYQLYYHGPTNTFLIRSVRIDGVEYLGSDAAGVSADRYVADIVDHSVSWAQFSSTTPLVMTVENISGAAATFRATLTVAASRG